MLDRRSLVLAVGLALAVTSGCFDKLKIDGQLYCHDDKNCPKGFTCEGATAGKLGTCVRLKSDGAVADRPVVLDAGGESAAADARTDATPGLQPDGAQDTGIDAAIGVGATGGNMANTSGTGGNTALTSSTGGIAGDTGAAGKTEGKTGGLAGGSGSSGTGGSSGKSNSAGTGGVGGSIGTGIGTLPPDAAAPEDAPVGGSADGSLVSTAGTSGMSSAGGTIAMGGTNASGGASTSIVNCGPLGSPTNGLVSAPITTFGSSAKYSCLSGYKLTGLESRACQADGTWSESAPTCAPVDCGSLIDPTNGSVNANTTTYNSTARYSCTSTGYTLSGNETRTCLANGTWSGSAPICQLVAASYGQTCSTTLACVSTATCCDGSNESCDGTRLPTGDGTNPGQFVISGDGLTVGDTITGLVWQRDGSGVRAGCSGTDNLTCTWAEAKAYCASLTLGGLSGWRLPGLKELRTIVDFTKLSPAIDQTAFPNTPLDWCWTSSPQASSPNYAWAIGFGGSGPPMGVDLGGKGRARCVR